ncbi:DUF305 domain-containing protein [Arthrobacter halodurans]|uniref:DUF305 domain-containing protein n=1 Tax=Arthrobacter halodurans TaxID=516699 RepID=A0ABV4ULV7_9MICC
MFDMSKNRTALSATFLAGGLILTGCTGGGTDPGATESATTGTVASEPPVTEPPATESPVTGAATESAAPGSSMMGGSSMGAMPGNSSRTRTPTDTMFVRMMIPHHEQAVQMSDIVLAKSGIDEPIVDLANKIKAAQEPEIEQMESWLSEWGQPTLPAGSGRGQMRGMAGERGIAELEAAEGDEAARVFLTHMIVHHQGAVQMAEREVANGTNQDVVDFASKMIEDQKAEIEVMKDLLADYR